MGACLRMNIYVCIYIYVFIYRCMYMCVLVCVKLCDNLKGVYVCIKKVHFSQNVKGK